MSNAVLTGFCCACGLTVHEPDKKRERSATTLWSWALQVIGDVRKYRVEGFGNVRRDAAQS